MRNCARLESLNPLSVLQRGYAAVSRDGALVTRAESVLEGDELQIRFADGNVFAKVGKKTGLENEDGKKINDV